MTKIIQRHDTAANWTAANPVLAAGEMGVETDTNKFKFGDGTTAWSGLAYAAGEGGGGSGTTLTSTDGATTYSKLTLGNNLVVIPPETPWTNPQMSSNSQDGYVASASSSSGDSGSAIWKAFDKDTTTPENAWWSGSVSMPQWIMLECPEPVRVTSCMMANEVSTPANFKSGYIQGSNDGNVFDTLYTITNRPDTTGLQETYTFENNTYYKYLRVYCTESHYGSGVSIQEIEFSGFVKNATAAPTLNVDSYTKTETDDLLSSKQDKLAAETPLKIYVDDDAAYRVTAVNGNINTADNTFTGTESGYLSAKEQDLGFTLADYNSWEFRTKIRFATNSTSGEQGIFGTGRVLTAFNIYGNSQMKWYLSSNGADWNIALYSPTTSFTTNTIYYIRLRFTGSQYIMERSTTGFDNMTTIASKSTSTRVYSTPITTLEFMRVSPAYGSSIYLEDTCFIGNGEVIWKAYDESKIGENIISATPATTSSLGVVQPDGTSITVSETGVISAVGGVQSETIHSMVVMTQAEYDALTTKDDTVLYLIREETV